MAFPVNRMRRMRKSETLRRMVRETILSVNDFIYPLFVIHGRDQKNPIKSMPGVYQFSVDHRLKEEIKEIEELGIPAIILFGIPEYKDSIGSSGFQDDGVVQQAIRLIKVGINSSSLPPDLLKKV